MSDPKRPKQVVVSLNVGGASILDRQTVDSLIATAKKHDARPDTLVALVVFLQLHNGSSMLSDEFMAGCGVKASDVQAAWVALQKSGWVTTSEARSVLHHPAESADEVAPPFSDWENPLSPLAAAWELHGGSTVTDFALRRLNRLAAEAGFVTLPRDTELSVRLYRAALPDQPFDALVVDLGVGEEDLAAAAFVWAAKGFPDLAPFNATAGQLQGAWCSIRAYAPKRHDYFSFLRAAMNGVTLDFFKQYAPAYHFLDKALQAMIDGTSRAFATVPLQVRSITSFCEPPPKSPSPADPTAGVNLRAIVEFAPVGEENPGGDQ